MNGTIPLRARVRASSGIVAILLCVACLTASSTAHAQAPNLMQRLSATDPAGASSVLKLAGRDLAEVAARVMPAVVNIESERQERSGTVEETGSGALMRIDGQPGVYVVTNRHVVANARLASIEILLHDGRVLTPTAKLEDPSSDLAVLKVPDPGIEPVQFGDSDNLDIGHFVIAMGSPFGLQQSVTLGIISAKGRRALELPGDSTLVNQDFLQTDAAINPGNSGGPLMDLDGRVIGVNTAIASQGGGNEGIGFSIPSNLVQFIIGQLLEHGRVRRAYLGVLLDENFDINVARQFKLDRKRGARVTQVFDGTPAASAGIRPDDIILNYDGIDIEDETDLINRVHLTPVSKRVRIVILRQGRTQSFTVTLAEKSEAQSSLPEQRPPQPAGSLWRNSSLSVLSSNDTLAEQLGLSGEVRGLIVSRVPASTGDAETELQLYDVIEEMARRPVGSGDDLLQLLEEMPETDSFLVKVRRIVDGESRSQLIVVDREDLESMQNVLRKTSTKSRVRIHPPLPPEC